LGLFVYKAEQHRPWSGDPWVQRPLGVVAVTTNEAVCLNELKNTWITELMKGTVGATLSV